MLDPVRTGIKGKGPATLDAEIVDNGNRRGLDTSHSTEQSSIELLFE